MYQNVNKELLFVNFLIILILYRYLLAIYFNEIVVHKTIISRHKT